MNQLHNRASALSQSHTTLDRLRSLSVLLSVVTDHVLAQRGLSYPRAELLGFVRDHGPLTQREISQVLHCTPRNVTDLVDALEAAGLVVRAPHPTDRRAALVTLTDSGQKLAAQLRSDDAELAANLFSGLADDELAAFITILDWTIARLRNMRSAN